jgi:hypothetical protein
MSGRRDGLLALCLFACLLSIYLLTFSGRYHSSDEMSMLAVTDSLARRGAWDIELLRWMGEQQGSFGPDGHLYSRKGIGTTLAALPFYWLAVQSPLLGNVQAAMLTHGLVTAATAALIFLLLRRLGFGQAVSLGTGLAFGLGTMAWPYARTLFSEPLAGLGLMVSFYFLIRYRDERDGWSVVLAGAGLALALLARLNNAIVAPFLGLLLLATLHRQYGRHWQRWLRPAMLFGLPVVAALLTTGWYNWLRFGSPLTTGYLPEERFATPLFEGLYGLTFSPGKGLFWYNPLLFAAVAAWPAFLRRNRPAALVVAAVVLGNLVFYAPWYLWWAGHAWGPRFLVTILPFAILPFAPAIESAWRHRRTLGIGLGLLVLASVAVQGLGLAVDFNLYLEEIHAELGLYHPATLFTLTYSPLLRQISYLRPENLDLAWARGGTIHWLALGLSLLVVTVSGVVLLAIWRRRSPAWAGLLILMVTLAAGLLLVYAPDGDLAEAAHDLASMERPHEAAALTESLATEGFQDAYDGSVWVWGVPDKSEIGVKPAATWVIGAGDPDPAMARFQVSNVRLDHYDARPGELFELDRLPVPTLAPPLRLDQVADLVAVDVKKDEVQPGETLPVALYWRALAPADTSYTVFVQAIDEAGRKGGQVDRLPCDGGCPTTTWRPDDLVGERYDLLLDAGAAPGRYALIAGMYDLVTGERLPWFDTEGNPLGDALKVGMVNVQP